MPRRPLVLVSALTVGDYLLWSWSLNGNHVVIALVAGLTLPPLALASLWLLALGLVRVIADAARGRAPLAHPRGARARGSVPAPGADAGRPATAEQAGASDRASRKLAA